MTDSLLIEEVLFIQIKSPNPWVAQTIAKFREPIATVNLEKYPFKEPTISLKP
jgi:hypothetical protein